MDTNVSLWGAGEKPELEVEDLPEAVASGEASPDASTNWYDVAVAGLNAVGAGISAALGGSGSGSGSGSGGTSEETPEVTVTPPATGGVLGSGPLGLPVWLWLAGAAVIILTRKK